MFFTSTSAVVQAQADSYYLNESIHAATLDELVNKDYIDSDQTSCNNQISLSITNGKVNQNNN